MSYQVVLWQNLILGAIRIIKKKKSEKRNKEVLKSERDIISREGELAEELIIELKAKIALWNKEFIYDKVHIYIAKLTTTKKFLNKMRNSSSW